MANTNVDLISILKQKGVNKIDLLFPSFQFENESSLSLNNKKLKLHFSDPGQIHMIKSRISSTDCNGLKGITVKFIAKGSYFLNFY